MKTKIAKSPYQQMWAYICGGPIISVAITPDCSLIAAASVDCKLYLLDKVGKLLWSQILDYEAWAVSIASSGRRIAVGTANKKPADGTVYVFDDEGMELFRYSVASPVWGVSLSENGAILATASWNNKAYRFIEKAETYYLENERDIGGKGLYGISLSRDGTYCAVSNYEDSFVILDDSFSISKRYPLYTGLYGAKLSPDAHVAVVGCRNGSFGLIPNLSNNTVQLSPQISSRPICGISMSDDGRVIALGSFDGKVYVTTAQGIRLWSFETDGEVWSTAMSSDGAIVCAGSGDRRVYLFRNLCSASVVKRIRAAESVAEKASRLNLKVRLSHIASMYLRYGLIDYGLSRLRQLAACDSILAEEVIRKFLVADIQENPTHYESHYNLGSELKESDAILAIHHYQQAANDPALRSSALNEAGECFSRLGWETAALSCFHRAKHEQLSQEEKRVIHNLARSYEDSGYWGESSKHYQLLLAWDITYLNALEHLQRLSLPTPPKMTEERRSDYTGLTVSLLGPDVPRVNEVDHTLLPVLEARAKELFIITGERAKTQDAIDLLTRHSGVSKQRAYESLDYNTILYLKYDHLLPEDEIKKLLELVNFLSLIVDNRQIKSALDIGSATGRYPTVLAHMGIRAIGIDIESDAMVYAQRKKTTSDYPYYLVGDAANLPFCSNSFDLVSCMMGTFAHFSLRGRSDICQQILRVLRPGGSFVISTWDIDCKHLTFLSMYTQSQKELIRRNSLSRAAIETFLKTLGLAVVGIKSFAFLPDLFSYELQLYNLYDTDIRRIVEFDLAMRSSYSDYHGQMFMIHAKKSGQSQGSES